MFLKFLFLFVGRLLVDARVSEIEAQSTSEHFQNSLEQQTFQNILSAIEGRLRNLDNLYSMQLSETLQMKLDQYQRKLDSLDTKIIRLESMVMLTLDKISDNISTKNYKDDVAKAQMYRKLDTAYDGLSHRISYMERKLEQMFDKVQTKVDSTLQRLERMEETMIQRNAEIESELTETLSIIDDYKSNNIWTNITKFIKDSVGTNFADSFVSSDSLLMQRVVLLQNQTTETVNMTKQIISTISSLGADIKGDFNSYANKVTKTLLLDNNYRFFKVADMNEDSWKQTHLLGKRLQMIELMVNSTRIEMQNGIRSLTLQIGKMTGKGTMTNDKSSLESLKKSFSLDLEKIISQQELFLESCHRVQMDEAQIESEISGTLNNLIEMLKTRTITMMKDLKSLERGLKSHDARINRNLVQANANIISLFEKTAKLEETLYGDLYYIKQGLNSLFGFEPSEQDSATEARFKKTSRLIHSTANECMNLTKIIKELDVKRTTTDDLISNEIRTSLQEIKIKLNITKPCKQNYRRLIDVRTDDVDCIEYIQPKNDPSLNKTILQLFGTPSTTVRKDKTRKNKSHLPNWGTLIDIRYDSDNSSYSTETNNGQHDNRSETGDNGETTTEVLATEQSESTTSTGISDNTDSVDEK